MFTNKKIASVSVINDLVSDVRVSKICDTLMEMGFDVILIGRKFSNSKPINDRSYAIKRLSLLINKGPLFYLFFNIRLFFVLLFQKQHLLYANDLDTLLPNFLVSKIKGVPIVYDSHELFCEVPELKRSPLKKRIWEKLERFIVPKLKHCITVSDGIANFYQTKYGVNFKVVRNISLKVTLGKKKSKEELGIPLDKKIILLQGAGINIDRGSEELVDAMQFVDNAILYNIGSGDVWEILKQKIKQQQLQHKVILIEKLPKSELMHYTANADLGISIDKNTNLNYYYSLPNKLFDYIHSNLPVLASPLLEIEKIIKQYQIGEFILSHEPKHIAEKINSLLQSEQLNTYKHNTIKASEELNWEKEKEVLIEIISNATH